MKKNIEIRDDLGILAHLIGNILNTKEYMANQSENNEEHLNTVVALCVKHGFPGIGVDDVSCYIRVAKRQSSHIHGSRQCVISIVDLALCLTKEGYTYLLYHFPEISQLNGVRRGHIQDFLECLKVLRADAEVITQPSGT